MSQTTADTGFGTGSSLLRRSTVSAHFPQQFRNAAALAHLAHRRRGPRYVLVGGAAWYDPADIRQWLESQKTAGPARRSDTPRPSGTIKAVSMVARKRGRPTKLDQMRRGQAACAAS